MINLPAKPDPNDRWLMIAVAVIATILFAVRYGYMLAIGAPGATFAQDFDVFYAATQHWNSGTSPYCLTCHYDPSGTTSYHPFLNAPFFMFVLWPLKFLGYNAALSVFVAAQLALWIVALRAPGTRALLPHLAQHRPSYIAALLCIPAPFLLTTIFSGQTGILYAALLLLGVGWLRTKPRAAGIAFGLLACKPTLGLMVPVMLIAGRQWRALISCAVTVLLLCVAASIVWGMGIWAEWLHVMQTHEAMLKMRDVPIRFLRLLVSLYGGGRLAGLTPMIALTLSSIAALFAAALLARQSWRAPNAPGTIALFLAATLLATPYLLSYDTVILAIIVLLLINDEARAPLSTLERCVLWMALFSPIIVPQVQAWSLPLGAPIIVAVALCCRRLLHHDSRPLQ